MTAHLRAMIEQAKRLTREERDALVGELLGMDEPQPPVLTREELDRQLTASIAQAERGEFVDEAEVLAELNE